MTKDLSQRIAVLVVLAVAAATIVPVLVAEQSCQQLIAKYDGSNWWWGAFGNCKRPGGPTTPDMVFQCAWNQVPAADQTDCLKAALRGTEQTRRAILDVAATNGGPDSCSALIVKYDGSNWWWGALGNCKRPGGPTTSDAVFECAWTQVPATEKKDCLKAALRQTDQTRRGIDVVIAANQPVPDACTQLSIKYNGSDWWWNALGNCAKPNGPGDRDAVFECAWKQVPATEQKDCLKSVLKASDQTRRGIDVVLANNRPISNNWREENPTDAEGVCHVQSVGTGYFAVPAGVVAPPEPTYNLSEGRLQKPFRDAARAADALDDLRLAAANIATNKPIEGNAFADLSVTGTRSFAQFKALNLTDQQLYESLRPSGPVPGCRFGCNAGQRCGQNCPARAPLPDLSGVPNDALLTASRKALDRAWAVAQILRVSNTVVPPAGVPDVSSVRKALNWIAVSGEDDRPYRPVNVPSTKYPQFDLTVAVHGVDFHTRYMIAQAQAPFANTTPAPGRVLPTDPEPTLRADADVLIFVHGMDSRVEEAETLADAFRARGLKNGKNYTIISMDLPGSGYADYPDHCSIPRPRTGEAFCDSLFALGDPKEPPQWFDAHGQHNVPVLDFLEDFIVSFVDTLDTKIPIKTKVRAVIGGSLGGNMGFRLGRRQDVPWLHNIVAWSAASVWDSLADGVNGFKHQAVRQSWMEAGGNPDELSETADKRPRFFHTAFDAPYLDPLPGPSQADTWMSDRWPCKRDSIKAARLDRLETYDLTFRLWHWRVAVEQLIYSQNGNGPNGQPLYQSNSTRMLLMCGKDDDFTGAGICTGTRKLAEHMTLTPGRAVLMQNTGHSLDVEHPNYVVRQIAEFLGI